MKFLIDVCVGTSVAAELTARGHDVEMVSKIGLRTGDPEILNLAQKQHRVLITIDKDFGALIFLGRHAHAGVVRLPDVRRAERVELVRRILDRHGEDLEKGAIITATKRIIRVRRPSAGQ